MKGFRYFGIAMIAGFLGLIIFAQQFSYRLQQLPPVDLVGFDKPLLVPKADYDAALSYAHDRSIELNGQGRWFARLGSYITWASFLCTSSITLILGYFGRGTPAPGQSPDTAGLGPGIAKTVGLLAAAGAVLIAGGSLVKDSAQDFYTSSDKAVALIRQAHADFGAAETAREQQDVLAELRRQVERL
jgi:hypothetical protein